MTDKAPINYKIKRKSDGLYSTGGYYPSFTKQGKAWRQLGHLKSHLALMGYQYIGYRDCEIVEIHTTIHDVPKNTLQIMSEQGIISNSKYRYPIDSDHNAALLKLLKLFVENGTCYSTEFKNLLCTSRSKLRPFVEQIVPHEILENFDKYHNKGLENCSTTELGAVILTATQEQITMFEL